MGTAKLDVKTKFAIGTAVVAFVAGWALTIAGFIIPPKGEVHDSVLWILGQALIYTASVLGIGMYFNNQMAKFRADTRRYIRGLEGAREPDPEPEEVTDESE